MLSINRIWCRISPRVPWRNLGRWWLVGLAFFGGGLGLLYLLTDVLAVPLILGTLLAAEFTTLLRFAINDRWVFGHRSPSWSRLWQYHIACAGGSAVWWVLANTLPRLGIHYLIASAAGSAASVMLSMITNFMWIWRRGPSVAAPSAVAAPNSLRGSDGG
jgi:putative flippase GtrA